MFARNLLSIAKRHPSRGNQVTRRRMRGRQLRLETLESREMFAGDVFDSPIVPTYREVELADRTVLCGPANETAACTSAVGQESPSSPWQNPSRSLDVNNDGNVTPLDALVIINDINLNGIRTLPNTNPQTVDPLYVDANGDGSLSPIDALLVINHFNALIGIGEPETRAGNTGSTTPVPEIGELPTIRLQGTSVSEDSEFAEVLVTLSSTSSNVVTFNYATLTGTAAEGADFVRTQGTHSFSANEQEATIRVPIVNDAYTESDERFFVQLTRIDGATVELAPAGDRALVTILNDDPFVGPLPPAQALAAASVDAIFAVRGA